MLLLIGVIAVALTKFAFFPDREQPVSMAQSAIVEPVVTVETGEITNTMALAATVMQDAPVSILSSDNVEIRAVHASTGAWVEAGQVLLTVRTADPVCTFDITAPERGTLGGVRLLHGNEPYRGCQGR